MTTAEEVFFKRVALTMEAQGLGIEEAMRAVRNRDEELSLLMATEPQAWNELLREMAAELYREIRAEHGLT